MPWTVDDVNAHKKGLNMQQKRAWCSVANSVLKKCMEDGGEESVCAASAIRQANGVVNTNEVGETFHTFKVPQE